MKANDVTGKKVCVKVIHRSRVKAGYNILWANIIVEVKEVSKEGVFLGDPINELTNYMFYYVVDDLKKVIE